MRDGTMKAMTINQKINARDVWLNVRANPNSWSKITLITVIEQMLNSHRLSYNPVDVEKQADIIIEKGWKHFEDNGEEEIRNAGRSILEAYNSVYETDREKDGDNLSSEGGSVQNDAASQTLIAPKKELESQTGSERIVCYDSLSHINPLNVIVARPKPFADYREQNPETSIQEYVQKTVDFLQVVGRTTLTLEEGGNLIILAQDERENPGDIGCQTQLYGLPWRIANRLQDEGWFLRLNFVWSKDTNVEVQPYTQVFILSSRPGLESFYQSGEMECIEDTTPEDMLTSVLLASCPPEGQVLEIYPPDETVKNAALATVDIRYASLRREK